VQIPPGKYSVVLGDSIVAVDVNGSGTSSEADVPIVTEVDELSLTGSNATDLLFVGFVLIGAGLLLAVGRRRVPR
jgi:LPXTG-motif cell wall-anchored protein